MGGDRDRLLYWPNFFSSIAHCYLQEPTKHFFHILAGVAQLGGGSLRALGLQAGPHSGLPVSNSNCLGTWLYYCLTPTWFRLFTQVHLLIDGSVEGQYITQSQEVWKTRKFNDLLLSFCNTVYKLNTIEKMDKRLHPLLPQVKWPLNH